MPFYKTHSSPPRREIPTIRRALDSRTEVEELGPDNVNDPGSREGRIQSRYKSYHDWYIFGACFLFLCDLCLAIGTTKTDTPTMLEDTPTMGTDNWRTWFDNTLERSWTDPGGLTKDHEMFNIPTSPEEFGDFSSFATIASYPLAKDANLIGYLGLCLTVVFALPQMIALCWYNKHLNEAKETVKKANEERSRNLPSLPLGKRGRTRLEQGNHDARKRGLKAIGTCVSTDDLFQKTGR